MTAMFCRSSVASARSVDLAHGQSPLGHSPPRCDRGREIGHSELVVSRGRMLLDRRTEFSVVGRRATRSRPGGDANCDLGDRRSIRRRRPGGAGPGTDGVLLRVRSPSRGGQRRRRGSGGCHSRIPVGQRRAGGRPDGPARQASRVVVRSGDAEEHAIPTPIRAPSDLNGLNHDPGHDPVGPSNRSSSSTALAPSGRIRTQAFELVGAFQQRQEPGGEKVGRR